VVVVAWRDVVFYWYVLRVVRVVVCVPGRVLSIGSLYTCVLGWNQMHGSAPELQVAFGALCLLVGGLVLVLQPADVKKRAE
jgi:hypothetical protein